MSRSILELAPEVHGRFGEWLRICNGKGVSVLFYETYRSNERQAELWAQGRDTPGDIVTKAKPGESFHNYRLAVDAIPWQYFVQDPERLLAGKKLDWTPFKSSEHKARWKASRDFRLLDKRWRTMAEAAAVVGIEWAGLWEGFNEYCHWQITGGLTIAELRPVERA